MDCGHKLIYWGLKNDYCGTNMKPMRLTRTGKTEWEKHYIQLYIDGYNIPAICHWNEGVHLCNIIWCVSVFTLFWHTVDCDQKISKKELLCSQ